jgi:hypothetical protein
VIRAKKIGKEAVGRGIDWGVSSPHTLLPKEEKEEKNASACQKMQKGCRKKAMIFVFIKRI